jgi:hypothetical protein
LESARRTRIGSRLAAEGNFINLTLLTQLGERRRGRLRSAKEGEDDQISARVSFGKGQDFLNFTTLDFAVG